ncbi:MAG: type IV secretory system conjugative DNA transfer family protein [Clostridia bacterium]|nr:type IV secretory system conjugative DNA transfer family protein [Clostridia bacterium]
MFVDEYVANNIQKSDFDIRNFAKKKTAIYVLLPDDRDTYHRLRKYFSKTNIYFISRNK